MLSNKQKALIKRAQREVGLSDAEYRFALARTLASKRRGAAKVEVPF